MTAKKQAKYVTPYKYAQLCGVSTTAINNRIKNGQLEVEEIENPIDGSVKRYVNTEKYPVAQTIIEIRTYSIETKRWQKNEG
ncbi:hypothetical protein [Pontibacter litorisediminis]|uniref:hypothetical protein n=1 Tax=Pontibacter litorisediminis TaxID=1846260 RepID=UPI0023EC104F|nr:hypothetical protein [Pontibacter litorisediminis]